jgi:hypothetical protein
MTKLRAVAHLRMGGGGWTDSKKLIWTSLTLSRPVGTDLDYTMMADLFLVTDVEISRSGELIWTRSYTPRCVRRISTLCNVISTIENDLNP